VKQCLASQNSVGQVADQLDPQATGWDAAIVAAITEELGQAKYLIDEKVARRNKADDP